MLTIFFIIAVGICCYFKRNKKSNTLDTDDKYKGVGNKGR